MRITSVRMCTVMLCYYIGTEIIFLRTVFYQPSSLRPFCRPISLTNSIFVKLFYNLRLLRYKAYTSESQESVRAQQQCAVIVFFLRL